MGVSAGFGWIGVADSTGLDSLYTLLINPSGGPIIVGATAGVAVSTHTIMGALDQTSDALGPAAVFTNGGSPYVANEIGGVHIDLSDTSPENTASYLLKGEDSDEILGHWYSDGSWVTKGGSYTAISDSTLKTHITDAPAQLDLLRAVRVREFAWKSDPDGKQLIRPTAQELAHVYPELVRAVRWDSTAHDTVHTDSGVVVTRRYVPRTILTVDTSQMTWRNVQAIQELADRMEELGPAALEARVATLEDQVDNLQTLLIVLGLAIGGGKAILLVRDKGILKKAA